MGARGNICIYQTGQDTPIYFYTHWQGNRIAETLADGLKKASEWGRLDDETYATRIIFDHFTGLDGSALGYGISIGSMCDNEYEVPTVRWNNWYEDPEVTYMGKTSTAAEFIERYASKVEA